MRLRRVASLGCVLFGGCSALTHFDEYVRADGSASDAGRDGSTPSDAGADVPTAFTLTIELAGAGSGQVASTPSGI